MKKLIISLLTFVSLIAFISCNESKNKENDSTKKTDSLPDSTIVQLSPEIENLLSYFDEKSDLPLRIDSVLIRTYQENFEPLISIKTKEVQLLATNIFEHDLFSRMKWDIESFYKIDSLKENGQYDEYVENIDIGMMKESDAYALFVQKIDEKTSILIWALEYSSYEACPYAAGNMILGTVLFEGQISDCFILGEIMSAGDPPVGMENEIYSVINNDLTISIDNYQETMDEDENYQEITEKTENHYVFSVSEGKLKVIK